MCLGLSCCPSVYLFETWDTFNFARIDKKNRTKRTQPTNGKQGDFCKVVYKISCVGTKWWFVFGSSIVFIISSHVQPDSFDCICVCVCSNSSWAHCHCLCEHESVCRCTRFNTFVCVSQCFQFTWIAEWGHNAYIVQKPTPNKTTTAKYKTRRPNEISNERKTRQNRSWSGEIFSMKNISTEFHDENERANDIERKVALVFVILMHCNSSSSTCHAFLHQI